MSAVEKVAANAAFSSSSSSIGQTNRKPNLLSSTTSSRVPTNPSPAESDLSHNSSDGGGGNSEFEEALKNIKALNGQSRLSDNEADEKKTTTTKTKTSSSSSSSSSATEKSSSSSSSSSKDKSTSSSSNLKESKNVFDIKLGSEDPKPKPDSVSSNCTTKKSSSESPLNSESISKLKTDLGNFFSKPHTDSPVEKKAKIFCEEGDSDSNDLNSDKPDSVKKDSVKKDSMKDSQKDSLKDKRKEPEKKDPPKSGRLNHSIPFAKKPKVVTEAIVQGNGDHSSSKTESTKPSSHLGADEKIRDSFKSFVQKSPTSSYNKMLLKKKDETNLQSVTSSSDATSSTKVSKSSSVRGNLFENFESSIASPEREDKGDDEDKVDKSRPKETNGQAESKILAIKSDKNNSAKNNSSDSKKETKDSTSEKIKTETTKKNICDKDSKISNHSSSSQSEGMKPNNKTSSATSLHLDDACPQLSPITAKESEGNSQKSSTKSLKETSDNCGSGTLENSKSKKRPAADSDPDVSNSADCKDEDAMPSLKRSRLDDMIGRLGSHIGVNLDAIPFEDDDDEESSKDSDSSEKPSDDNESSDDEDSEKPATDRGQKIIRMTQKELAAIIEREVEKILNSRENNNCTDSQQQKIDELQAANEGCKTRAKDLHERLLEVLERQKSEKKKMSKSHSTRTVGIQVDESKILPSTQPQRSGALSAQLNTPPANLSKFQSPTVKSLLDASRHPNQVSNPAVMYQSSPGLYVVQQPPTTTSTAQSILSKPVTSHISATQQQAQQRAAGGSVKVIDLTDDDSDLNSRANGKNLLHAASIAPMGQLRAGMVGQQVVRQLNPLQQQQQQQAVPPGTSFLLSTPAGTQIISPTVTQGMPGSRPGVCQYVLTAPPNIRPGSLVTVVPTPGGTQNPSIRPQIASNSLPQLRPAQPSSSLTSVDLTKGIRPPPPLQSAPMSQRVVSSILSSSSSSQSLSSSVAKHPAPLPPTPSHNVQTTGLKSPPPKPGLRITRVAQGIVLSWNMTLAEAHAEISNYQLYAYQEGSASSSTSLWKKVGDIKALPLPMACTLTQFHEGNKYHFGVRAVDAHGRFGPFSDPNTINLGVGGK